MSGSLQPFVGRRAEVEALEQALARAASGAGSAWLVGGEPGIGKSRLVELVAGRALEQGLTPVFGRCWEVGGAPPYWPWVQALRTVGRRHPEVLEGRHPQLSRLLPELGGQAAVDLSVDEARFQLWDAIGGALLDLAERSPLLLVLEDLHAADPSSLLLAEFLAAQVQSARLVLLATHRETPLPALTRLARTCRTVALARLGREEVASFLGRATGCEVTPEVVDAAHRVSEGHPLFLVEVLRALEGRADARPEDVLRVPGTVRAAIRQHLAALPDAARAVAEVGAVLGREVPLELLGALVAVEGLEQAKTQGLLLDDGPGQVRFAHVLYREVLYDDLDPEARRALHLRAADRLAAEAEPPWSALAHHLLAAGAWDRAAEVAVCAAEASRAQLAFDDEVRWFERALRALDHLGAAGDERRPELLLGLASARVRAGAVDEGRAAALEAAELGRRAGSPEVVARAALVHGEIYVFGAVDDGLVRLLREALDGLDAEGPLRARVLARLAAALQPADDVEGPIALAHEAIETARRIGRPDTLLECLGAAVSALMDVADPAVREPLNREAAALARQLGDGREELRACVRLVFDRLELGEVSGAESALERAAALCEAVPSARWRILGLRAMMAVRAGRLDEGEALAASARAIAEVSRDPNAVRGLLLFDVLLLRLRGRHHEALEQLEAARHLFPAPGFFDTAWRLLTAVLLARCGRLQEARARVDEACLHTAVHSDLSVCELGVELAVAWDDRALARRLRARLREGPHRFVSWGAMGLHVGAPAAHLLGLVCGVLEDPAAERHLEEAARIARRIGAAPQVAWATFEHAARVDGQRREALLSAAAEEARACGLTGLVEAVEALRSEVPEPAGPEEGREAAGPGEGAVRAGTGQGTTPAGPGGEGPGASAGPLTLERAGDLWELRCGEKRLLLRDTKGVRWLAQLVAQPGREVHVLDLATGGRRAEVDEGHAGELIDATARDAYRHRARELRESLAEAEEWNDAGRAERIRGELEFLEEELRRSLGLGGRHRRSAEASERARVNVQRRLKDAIRRISDQDPQLGRAIGRALRTGTTCCYDP